MQINCLHPSFIFNPLLQELISLHGNLSVNGSSISFYKSQNLLLYDFKPQNYLPSPSSITLDNCDNYHVDNCVTGERYPAYIQVPCGSCEVCRNAKVNAFVDRCKLETQLYNCKPIFLTLTYDELHKKECGVCLRDVQLFFKRLRISLFRKGYREKIRYVLVSEYGKWNGKPENSYRPHYHCILWNLHQTDFLSYLDVRTIIEKSWSNGFVCSRLVEPSNDKAFYYTAKYLRKDCHVPEGCNKTFMVCSNRGGSIGAPFIDLIREKAVKHLNTSIKYVNKWNSRVFDVQTNRYMLNRLCPSLSHSLPYSLKCRVRRFVKDYHILYVRGNINMFEFDNQLDSYIRFFNQFFFVPSRFPECKFLDDKRSSDLILREMLQDEIFIERAMSRGEQYYEDAVYYAGRRETYLTKLFAHVTEQDLPSKAYRIGRNATLSKARLII